MASNIADAQANWMRGDLGSKAVVDLPECAPLPNLSFFRRFRHAATSMESRLQAAGLIRYARGQLTVLDRKRLEAASCACYGALRLNYQKHVGKIGRFAPEPSQQAPQKPSAK